MFQPKRWQKLTTRVQRLTIIAQHTDTVSTTGGCSGERADNKSAKVNGDSENVDGNSAKVDHRAVPK
eukprot:585794-Rhodomonas_salina.3